MEIFNIGILELVFIAVLALVLLGPAELISTMRKGGRLIHRFIKSPYWRSFLDIQQEIKEMPTKLIREAGLQDSLEEARLTVDEFNKRNLRAVGQGSSQIQPDDQATSHQQPMTKIEIADPVSPADEKIGNVPPPSSGSGS